MAWKLTLFVFFIVYFCCVVCCLWTIDLNKNFLDLKIFKVYIFDYTVHLSLVKGILCSCVSPSATTSQNSATMLVHFYCLYFILYNLLLLMHLLQADSCAQQKLLLACNLLRKSNTLNYSDFMEIVCIHYAIYWHTS